MHHHLSIKRCYLAVRSNGCIAESCIALSAAAGTTPPLVPLTCRRSWDRKTGSGICGIWAVSVNRSSKRTVIDSRVSKCPSLWQLLWTSVDVPLTVLLTRKDVPAAPPLLAVCPPAPPWFKHGLHLALGPGWVGGTYYLKVEKSTGRKSNQPIWKPKMSTGVK